MTVTFLIAEIAVEPGWAVGAVPLDNPALDRDLLLDIDGRPYVPGSSLAGSLRAHLRRHDDTSGTTLETDLMGARPPKRREDIAAASRLWFLGTRFTPDDDAEAMTETTGRTAVDRHRHAPRARSLRHSRAAAQGGVITAFLRHDGPLDQTALDVVATWRPAIGRDRTSGAGRARLQSLRHGTIDPAQPAGARTWLTFGGEDLVRAVATRDVSLVAAADAPWRAVEFFIEDALLVGDGQVGDAARFRTRAGRAIIPGSTWKGIFRGRVEYMLRSLRGLDAVCAEQTGCGCLACDVFGHQGRRGRLAFRDSVIDVDAHNLPARTQVGIDRVTGGARDSLLYRAAPLTTGRLSLRVDLLEPVDDWVATAIDHVINDIDDGLIGVGSRTTRGMGTLRCVNPPPAPPALTVPGREAETTREEAAGQDEEAAA